MRVGRLRQGETSSSALTLQDLGSAASPLYSESQLAPSILHFGNSVPFSASCPSLASETLQFSLFRLGGPTSEAHRELMKGSALESLIQG